MTTIPEIRVGVDWDGDWDISWEQGVSDPLNLFPDDAVLRDDQTMASGSAKWLVVDEENPFSQYAYHVFVEGNGDGIKFSTKEHAYATPTTDTVFQSGSFVLPDAGTYTLSLYVRRPAGTPTSIGISVYDEAYYETGSGFWDGMAFVPSSNNWERADFTFTAPAGTYPKPLHIDVVSFDLFGAFSDFEISYRAALLPGSTPMQVFNPGYLSLYDNLTPYTLKWSSKLGRSSSDNVFPAEGTLSLVLDNTTRIFSPENTASPLYGKLKLNRRVVVQIKRPSTGEWEAIWAGYISRYGVSVGGTGDGQATIEAQQGFFRLNKLVAPLGVLENRRFDEMLDLVLPFGYQSANAPAGITDKHRVDYTALFINMDKIRQAEQGVNVFPLLGDGWDADTSIASVLKEILEVERGLFWIDRAGMLRFYNRHHYKDVTPVDDAFSIDTDANTATYSFGGKVYNTIKVSYFPKEIDSDQVVWTSKEPILVGAKKSVEVDVTFETESERTINVLEINDAATVITANTNKKGTGINIPSHRFAVSYKIENGSGKLKIYNNYTAPIYVTVELHATAINSYGGQTYTAEPTEGSVAEASLQDNDKSVHSVSNKLLTSEDAARLLGDYWLSRYGLPRGLMGSVTMKSRNADWLERMLDLKVGTYIQVSEYQTAVTQVLVVIGEEHQWQPGIWTAKYITDVAEYYPISTLTEDQTEFVVCY